MKLRPCETCGAESANLLVEHHARSWLGFEFNSGLFQPLCAEHLTLAFGQAFRAYGHQVIVFPPPSEGSYLKESYCPSAGYHFRPANELGRSARPIVEATFDLVTGPCSACGLSGSVAYAGDDDVDESTVVERLDHGTVLTIMCKGCAFGRLAPTLARNCALFKEHIELPYGGAGVLCMKHY
jgi:hypothetical protein